MEGKNESGVEGVEPVILELAQLGEKIVEIAGGKKKRKSPSNFWQFTLNNYTQEDIKNLEGADGAEITHMVFQTEDAPTTGTPHLQGFTKWSRRVRPMEFGWELMGHKRLSWKHKGRNQTVANRVQYCSDPNKRNADNYLYVRGFVVPEPLKKMTREMCRPLQLEIADKYIEKEDELFGREIHWYFEEEGKWGKTQTALYMIDQMGATLVSGARKDVCFGICKLVEKQGACPPIVIVDIPKDGSKFVSYAGLEKIKDGAFFSEKFESGMCRFNKPHIVCFANEPPNYEKMSIDRWKVFNVNVSVTEPAELPIWF